MIAVDLCKTEMSAQPGMWAGDSQHIWLEFEGEHELLTGTQTALGGLLKPAPLC